MAILENSPIKATEMIDALNKKVNTSDVLSLEEIKTTEDLTGKVASASALKKSNYQGDSFPKSDNRLRR